jgi:hypothetical protein
VTLINKPETNVCSVVYCRSFMTSWIKMLRGPGPWEEQNSFHTSISRLSISATLVSAQPRTSCRSVFKQSDILTVPCQHILSLINFITNNQEIFKTNSSLHNINTRNKHYLHRSNAKQSCSEKRTFYADIKIFNSLAPSVTVFKNDKAKFKAVLRKYLHAHCFYCVD